VDTLYLNESKYKANWKDNKVEFKDISLEDPAFDKLFTVSVLCNDAEYNPDNSEENHGDPLEIGLLRFTSLFNDEKMKKLQAFELLEEDPFDAETKRMGTIHKSGQAYIISAKGAAESIFEICTHYLDGEKEKEFSSEAKKTWKQRNDELAGEGFRTLAFAFSEKKENPQATESNGFLKDMTLIGLIGFLDPPRKEVVEAIDTCLHAGIDVVMITGDHPGTALNIAKSVHIIQKDDNNVITGRELEESMKDQKAIAECKVFARVNPEQKLTIIKAFQEQNKIIGMTGDGVNDAPALKKADIGIAMGSRGTQVAKEVADMVLKDDSFASIVKAIREGRIIFSNIRKFVVYQLSYHLSEVIVIAAIILILYELALFPLQLLYLNIILDVFPALALGLGFGRKNIMDEPPKKQKEDILTKRGWGTISIFGFIIALTVTSSYLYAYYHLNLSVMECNTIAFFTLSLSQLLNVFNMRDPDEDIFNNQVVRNKYIWMAIALCLLLLALAYFVPGLKDILSLQDLDGHLWLQILITAFSSLVLIQIVKKVFKI
jgi:P-type Ca2+ transporter type 2C